MNFSVSHCTPVGTTSDIAVTDHSYRQTFKNTLETIFSCIIPHWIHLLKSAKSDPKR
jgi:hypothetical protein